MPQGLSAGEWGLGHTCPGRRGLWHTGPKRRARSAARAGAGVSASYQWPRWTTSLNGRRSGLRIGASGRSAG